MRDNIIGSIIVLSVLTGGNLAQQPESVAIFWSDAADNTISSAAPEWDPRTSTSLPVEARIVTVDGAALRVWLASFVEAVDVGEAQPQAVELLSIPLPNDEEARFRIEPVAVLPDALARSHPGVVTVRGIDQRDRSRTLRATLRGERFDARIQDGSGTVAFRPIEGDIYAVYRLSGSRRRGLRRCNTPGAKDSDGIVVPTVSAFAGETRTMRLAIATTGEFVGLVGGTQASAIAEIAHVVNLVSGIYERELGIQFQLVTANDKIVFTDPATDGFTDGDEHKMILEAQQIIDTEIGDANYDIGHVLAGAGGGLAELESACVTGKKAMGVSPAEGSVDDDFVVSYLAHELGHQLGADHTYNGTHGGCTHANYSLSTAFEPGSGSTIMSYAGICGHDNIQAHSDEYFHFASLEEIHGHTRSTACSAIPVTRSGNRAPRMTAGPDLYVPRATPFWLHTAVTDPDDDPVLLTWEQSDLGPRQSMLAADNGSSPLIRSFGPSTSDTRYFPNDWALVHNVTDPADRLPEKARDLGFRITARDARPDGAGVSFQNQLVKVVGTAGPFRVVEPTPSPHAGWMPIEWSVADTDQPPLEVSTVDIALSRDGIRYEFWLGNDELNDGVTLSRLPSFNSPASRLFVLANGRPFYSTTHQPIDIRSYEFAALVVPQTAPGFATSLPPSALKFASALADLLAKQFVDAVLVHGGDPLSRDLLAPTASSLNTIPVSFDSRATLRTELDKLENEAALLVAMPRSELPGVLAELGAIATTRIDESEYDHILVIAKTASRVMTRHYRVTINTAGQVTAIREQR